MRAPGRKRIPLGKTLRFFVITIFLTVLLESEGLPNDPWAAFAWHYHADLSSWIPVRIVVSPLEISVMIIVAIWWFSRKKLRGAFQFRRGSLDVPVLVFAALAAVAYLEGVLGGGNATIALWEVRGFIMFTAMYFVTGILIRDERYVNQLVWAIFLGATGLAIENIYRHFAFASFVQGNDVAYDHIDSIMLTCAIVLAVAIFAFGGTRAQRRFAAFGLPLWFFCTLIMDRRAAFPVMGIGIVVLAIFILRLRPRVFWTYGPPIILITIVYMVIFWHNTGTLGQPARALSSMFTPDPRDYASNLYRMLEKADIILNAQAHPILGLGFGQPYIFYISLPDLSFWPFWHYMSHNADLWIWMKMGAIGFIFFWWLIGRAAYDGSVAVETQREEWNVVAELIRRLRPKRKSYAKAFARTPSNGNVRMVVRSRGISSERRRHLGLNTPPWERSDEKRSKTALPTATLAILVTAVCMVLMQIVYSYVDLGLTNERSMLLLGLMFGLIAHGHALLGVQPAGRRPVKTVKPSASEATVEEVEDFLRHIAPPRATVSEPRRGPSYSRTPQPGFSPPSGSRSKVVRVNEDVRENPTGDEQRDP